MHTNGLFMVSRPNVLFGTRENYEKIRLATLCVGGFSVQDTKIVKVQEFSLPRLQAGDSNPDNYQFRSNDYTRF